MGDSNHRSSRRDDHGGERNRQRDPSPSKRREKDKENEKQKDTGCEVRDRVRTRDRERVREKDCKRGRVHGREKDVVKDKIFDEDSEYIFEVDREREKECVFEEKEREKKRKEEWERRKEKKREREKRDGDEERERERERDDRVRKRRRREKERESSNRSKRHREKSKDNKETTLEEEQWVLDEEMDKRRRRVHEWQELKKEKEEREREKLCHADDIESRKKWTLEGESDDEEDKSEVAIENGMDVGSENGKDESLVQNVATGDMDDDEIDPLDAFMNSMVLPEVEKLTNNALPAAFNEREIDSKVDKASNGNFGVTVKRGLNKSMGRIIPGEDSDSGYEEDEDPPEEEDDEEFMKRVKKTKVDKLVMVDHSKIDYPLFRKDFYREVKEISKMSSEEVDTYKKQLELKSNGKDIPNPINSWHQIGLSTKILDTIKKLNFEKPMPIQAQAFPIIMSGRDCIGVAKTGSGKTLAFVLPMLRHIKDQPPLMSGDGPIGLIMAPTRELVLQIHSEIKKFIKPLGLTCVPVYGGSGVKQQIGELKRGAEIVVCTPGRMIDILCTSAGKITNLRRVTYLVMDEADRMFDMGFEPQITRILQNIRPDRQTVLFSATFPRQVDTLARKVLENPVKIEIGGKGVVNKDITQFVEVRTEDQRFLRLLELLGEWYEKGKVLVFVQSQDKCDELFKNLLGQGYPCLSLHGGKEQSDRESTISDFKSNVCNLLVATSIAARGLDVKELELVINFDAPNHYEDYVHRVGRTGRAGRKGCAITFISEDDDRYAPDLVKALQLSDQVVPDDLKALADGFSSKVDMGLEKAHVSGFIGKGFKFNEQEEEARKAVKKALAKEYGFEEDESNSEDENDGVRKVGGDLSQQAVLEAATSAPTLLPNGGVQGVVAAGGDGAARAVALAAAMNLQHSLAKIQADTMADHFEAELEINELPQNAKFRVMHKETLGRISEWSGTVITIRGRYFSPGEIVGPGDRKLYLFIAGNMEQNVRRAKTELKRFLEDIMYGGSGQTGKYSIV